MQKKRIFKGAFTCRWAPSDGADGKDGDPGKDGTGIKSADVVFVLSASNTSEPSDTAGWVTTFTQLAMKENTYVWSCTKIVLTDGTSKYTGKQCLGASKDFITITEQYAVGSSPTTAPTSGWGTTYTPTKELWLWTRNRMEWKNGTVTYTTPLCVSYFGKDGADGKDGDPGDDGNGISSQTSYFIATDKKSVASYSSVSGWSTTFPTPSDQKPYVWKCVRTIYTKSGTTYSTPELVTTYHSGDNGNILENASFTDADNMEAWNVKSQYQPLSGKTAPQDLGSIDTSNKKDGRNSYHDTCKATGVTITCKDMLRQKVHHPAGGIQKLAAGQWYTLSFWAKGRTKPIVINETSSNYGFATKELYLIAGRTYTIRVIGKCDSTAVVNGKELRTYIYATDWSEGNSCATKSTSVTAMSMTFTPQKTGAYRISSYQYDNTEPRTGKVTVQQYEITDQVDLVTYIYPTAVDTSTKMIVDGIEVTTPSDLGYSWKLTDEWTRHSVTFKTKQNLTTEEQNCLFRLMPAINEEGYREAWICMPKLESGMFATGFIDGIDDLRGIPGLIERTSEWSAETEYHNDESLSGGIRYLDIVTVTDNTTGSFTMYQCRVTHTSTTANAPSGGDSIEWLKLNQMRPIYTPLIVAKNAVLRFAQTNRILITNSQDKVQGCFGGVEDETNGYPLWIGGVTAAAAKFRVKYGGQLEASEASITGTINATNGKIAGFTISGTSLTNTPWTNDATIIFRNDNKKCFAGIGGNVLPASTGLRAVARFENEDKTNQWGLDKNIAMILSAKNGTFNFAFTGRGNGILNGAMAGYAMETKEANKENTCFILEPTNALSFHVKVSQKNASIGLPTLSWICLFLGISQGTEFAITIDILITSTATSGNWNGSFIYGRNSKVNGMDTKDYPSANWTQEKKNHYYHDGKVYDYYFTEGLNRIVLVYKNGSYLAYAVKTSEYKHTITNI
jgi:hypothetical protein